MIDLNVERNVRDDIPASGTRIPRVTRHLNTVFRLLGSTRCRYVLYYLSANEGAPVDVDDLITAIRTYEASDGTGSEPPPRKELWIALYHTYLPRLADVGVLEYDRRQGTVQPTISPAVEEWVVHARHREFE